MTKHETDIEPPLLEAVIDRFEDGWAVLRLADNQQLNWPSDCLPAGLRAGSAVKLKLLTDQEEEAEREKLAKQILNEILKGSK